MQDSELGFGTVGYLRMVSEMNNVHGAFEMPKSRVAPQRRQTIPKLELSAAVLGVQLGKFLQREKEISKHMAYYWTDSSAVLQFINNRKRRFNIFVANRLLKIHNGSTSDQWHYADSCNNLSYLLSLREMPKAHDRHPTWIAGPEFLRILMDSWSATPLIPLLPESNVELKKAVNNTQVGKSVSENSILSEL